MLSQWLSRHHVGQVVACKVVGGHLASTEVRGVAVDGELECSICLEQLAEEELSQSEERSLLAVLACGHR